MPRVGLLLHVLDSRLIFILIAAMIGKRMPVRSIRWLADRTLQGIIFGCTGMVMSYAMLPAWELCLGWLATCFAWRTMQLVLVVVLWQIGVRVLGGWMWDKTADHLRDRRARKAKAKADAEAAAAMDTDQAILSIDPEGTEAEGNDLMGGSGQPRLIESEED